MCLQYLAHGNSHNTLYKNTPSTASTASQLKPIQSGVTNFPIADMAEVLFGPMVRVFEPNWITMREVGLAT